MRASVKVRVRRLVVCGVRLWRREVCRCVVRHRRLPADLLGRQPPPLRVWGLLRPGRRLGERRGVRFHAERDLVDPVAMVGVEPRVPVLRLGVDAEPRRLGRVIPGPG